MRNIKHLIILVEVWLIILIIFSLLKQSVCMKETTSIVLSDDFILKTKQILYNALKDLINSEPFVDKYGRNIFNSNKLTDHYIFIICNTTFINTFLELLPLEELLNKKMDVNMFFNEINNLFLKYVENSIIAFEHTSVSTIELFTSKIKQYLYNTIRNDPVFYSKYIVQTKYAYCFDQYYIKVLCNKYLLDAFLSSILLENIFHAKGMMIDKVTCIQEQFQYYINNSLKVMSDIIEISVQSNINIQQKEDVYVILKEYAKLLPISKTKYMLVTEKIFLQDLLDRIDWSIYINSNDFLLNNMFLLKQYYYYTITKTTINPLMVSSNDIQQIIYMAKPIIAFIKANSTFFFYIITVFFKQSTPEILYNLDIENIHEVLLRNDIAEHIFTQSTRNICENLFIKKNFTQIVYAVCFMTMHNIIIWIQK